MGYPGSDEPIPNPTHDVDDIWAEVFVARLGNGHVHCTHTKPVAAQPPVAY